MTYLTPFLNFPLIAPAQAQKHITHNEAMLAIDRHVHLSVIDSLGAPPPQPPQTESRYRVAPAATAEWEGHDNKIAISKGGGQWMFLTPQPGWRCWTESDKSFRVFDGLSWVLPVTSERLDRLGIQVEADDQNRLTVSSAGSLFTHDGADHRLTINKDTSSDTGSVLFQSGYQGCGEVGLAGDNDLSLKVSSDGNLWRTGLRIDSATGEADFPSGSHPSQFVPHATPETYVYGPPNRVTTSYNTSNITLAKSRMYFCPFYVDRPVEIDGGLMVQPQASSDSGSVIRAGLFKLSGLESSGWTIGDRLSDFGALPADTTGSKVFEAPAPIIVSPGWYVAALGTNGAGAQFKYARWMTPGQLQYVSSGSGSSLDLHVTGASTLLYSNAQSGFITGGLPADWGGQSVSDADANYHYTRQPFIPHWRPV